MATRDELARHLYIRSHDCCRVPHLYTSEAWQNLVGREWDSGGANRPDVADCYARTDQMISDGVAL